MRLPNSNRQIYIRFIDDRSKVNLDSIRTSSEYTFSKRNSTARQKFPTHLLNVPQETKLLLKRKNINFISKSVRNDLILPSLKNTTLKIEGESSGASWTIGVVVNSGDTVLEYYPPPVNPNPPSGPVAAFSWVLDELQA